MTQPMNAERLSTDSDLSLSAFDEAMKILAPTEGGLGCVELLLTFGPGCFGAAEAIDHSLRYVSGVILMRHYSWKNYKEDEWSLTDRNSGRSVWSPGT